MQNVLNYVRTKYKEHQEYAGMSWVTIKSEQLFLSRFLLIYYRTRKEFLESQEKQEILRFAWQLRQVSRPSSIGDMNSSYDLNELKFELLNLVDEFRKNFSIDQEMRVIRSDPEYYDKIFKLAAELEKKELFIEAAILFEEAASALRIVPGSTAENYRINIEGIEKAIT